MYEAMSSGAVPRSTAVAEVRAVSCKMGSTRSVLKRDSFDSDYIRRLKESDADTERHFARYFGELLLIKLRARLRHPQSIEDVRQETFVRVLTALKTKNTLQSPESLGAFVNSVCNNLLFEMYRRDSQQRRHVEMDERFDPPDNRASTESEMVTRERCEEVRQVLDELPAKDRQLLRMLFYEDADKAEICRSFRVDREYLRVLMHRARTRFRECMQKRNAEGRADA
jgi:RNA polymerase sigma-70 factor (ECF subfamily)